MPAHSPVLRLDNITHHYTPQVQVLCGVQAEIDAGQLVALVGVSGLGKSTLLHIAGLMEKPTSGKVWIQNQQADSDAVRTRLRRQHIGFVFQFHHLLPEFTAMENVALVGRIGGMSALAARKKATELLHHVGLAQRLNHYPSTLSGGECQRVAIARALVNDPSLLLLDEPTGNLDAATATEVFGLIIDVVKHHGLACLFVTHNHAQADLADTQVSLVNGQWHNATDSLA